MEAQNVIEFWFHELKPSQWFKVDSETDNLIKMKFGEVLKAATQGELFSWRTTAHGRLAEIIVLDQFSRNIHRNQPEAFAADDLALILAQEMVLSGLDQEIPLEMRAFLYMPYMHSESRLIHNEAVKLFSIEGLESNYKFEIEHKKIIDQFGRYPHRNAVLGRLSTFHELEFLQNHKGF